ncbi:hypothetical protein TCAL_02609 [Tigriopus californicus]|uniref:tRNA-dihydrouridine(47) synthase [NAD(P)(+)] n=1 Tax=Tigriopus californicus TaxID=6832 RepID=A0A553NCW4_TIGCA|nr:tRNA-dihydrouridine(47) synthase [NAD(P)(+)]-like [Tigriopus californicus]TRY63255.1 hypothetical protein TCAL_02609 [Tigriopus californicus]|eukprot:TCALIF_02609-PA protein Name:"Similar to dus3l tRNA-dihydrouridine(47) synthase [NAD(P)(+)]-like (Xenopus tropicalis)" AED:0.02 eAED:0.02 QI:0/-1/0/1/-1/1/1/0/588
MANDDDPPPVDMVINGDQVEVKINTTGEDVYIYPDYLLPNIKHEPQASNGNGASQNSTRGGKGRNKKRPPPLKFERSSRVCPILINVLPDQPWPQCDFPNCAYIHDVAKYLEGKLPDLEGPCPNFSQFGRCPRGVTCRFARQHIEVTEGQGVRAKEDKELIRKWEGIRIESNHLPKDLQTRLRKKDYDFKVCDKLVDDTFNARAERKEEVDNATEDPPSKKVKVEEGLTVAIPEKKKIDWTNKLYLAPLTTVGNLPFRRICKKFGADITCGEMAMGLPLLQGHQPEWALLQRHHTEDLFGIQLCGSSPQQMARVAHLVEEHVDCDFVDINLGCPIDLVYKKGWGSGLMGRKKPLEVMIRAMTQILTRPLTVKMRTGIYMDKKIAHTLIPAVRDWGAQMITLHGRSREQRYTKEADWEYIKECREAAQPMPLFGNGDVLSYEDYISRKTLSSTDGIMIARGALIRPWVFKEIKENRHWDISASERLDMIKDYVQYGLEHWGSDDKGLETTRRFLLEWLSFLHRYVPHGILEHPPQKINQRIPNYRGRNEMESLLSSPNCADWIKITEMFLGKVPDNFDFVPKHKANSYK